MSLRLIDTEEQHIPDKAEEEKREARAFSNDVLYWKVRAERRELIGTYDNVQSCLLALSDVAKLTKEGCEEEDDYLSLLSRIRERAKITLKAIETQEG